MELLSLNWEYGSARQLPGMVNAASGNGCTVISRVYTEAVHPLSVFTCRLTWYFFSTLKVWVIVSFVFLLSIVPSPRSHFQSVIVPALAFEASANLTSLPTQAGDIMLKAAMGKGFTVILFIAVSEVQP